jgi:hypothetical protein
MDNTEIFFSETNEGLILGSSWDTCHAFLNLHLLCKSSSCCEV